MSNRFEAALSRSGINTAGPQLYWQLRSTTAIRLRVLEIGIAIRSAPTTAPAFMLARATSSLGTANVSLAGQAMDAGDANGVGVFESGWSSGPGLNSTYRRMMGLPVTAGGGFIWSWPVDSPLIIGAASTPHALQILNANASGATTGTFDAYAVWEE